MPTTATASHVRTDQIVFTYVPTQWPAGLLTGERDDTDGFRLHHVVAFDHTPTSALALVRAGLQAAWAERFHYVLFRVPHAHPQARGLRALALRVGAIQYALQPEEAFFVVYRPSP